MSEQSFASNVSEVTIHSTGADVAYSLTRDTSPHLRVSNTTAQVTSQGIYRDALLVSVGKVSVSVASNTTTVSISVKPRVLAQEARTERLNQSIRMGYAPASSNTKG
jgi:hypothetical protein